MGLRKVTIPSTGDGFGQLVQDSVSRLARDIDERPLFPYGRPTRMVRSDRRLMFDELVRADPSDGAITLTLPRGRVRDMGRTISVSNTTSSTANITVQIPEGNIDGAVSQTWGVAWSLRQFVFLGRDASDDDIWIMLVLE